MLQTAIRWTLIGVALALILGHSKNVGLYSVATIVLTGLLIDLKAPFTLRNVFIVYTVGLFYVGTRLVYPLEQNLMGDLLLYLGFFSCGYALLRTSYSLIPTDSRVDLAVTTTQTMDSSAMIERILWLLAGVEFIRLLGSLASYGVAGFYSGRELTNRIASYKQSGSTTAAIVNILLTAVIAATVALYFEHCLQASRRINYKLLLVTLILLPALTLNRSVVVYHALLLGAVFVCDKRIRPVTPGTHTPRVQSRIRRWLPIILVLIVTVYLGIRIGEIRSQAIDPAASQQSSLEGVLRGEFTPIQFYRESKSSMGTIHYQLGVPIVTALATRIVPRVVWGGKPATTQEIYMRRLHPAALAAGSSLAPSVYGVLYPNFGLLGTAMAIFLLGWAIAYYDLALLLGETRRMPQFLIVATWAYSVMRDDLATSLFSVLLTFVVYRALRSFMRGVALRQGGEDDTSHTSLA